MNKQAILHQSDSRFSFPVSDTKAVIRLRTQRDDSIKSVTALWNTSHKFYLERLRMPLTVECSDELFDYYVAELDNGYPGYSYLFEIVETDGSVWYYNESGFSHEFSLARAFQDNFTVVFPNERDIVRPNKKFEGRLFYQIFPERFARSNDKKNVSYITMDWNTDEPKNDLFAGGDLNGIIEKLPYLQDLGVGAIYMTPIHPSISAHKYDVDDYFDIDKMFGSLHDLKRLTCEAHKRDILIVMDLVFNHSSYLNPIFQDVVKHGKNSKYYGWYFIDGDKPDWEKLNYKSFCDVRMMPKLNTNNPEVQEYLCRVGEFYLSKYDVDGFRLDVAMDVSHDFWRVFKRRMLAVKPDVFIFGEFWQNSESFLGNDQWDSVMNYPFLYACQRYFAFGVYDAAAFCDYLNSMLMRYKDGTNRNMVNLIDSHDIERFFTTVGNDKDLQLMTLATLMCYLGCPMIYYGDEIFMDGKNDPYNRKAMRWDSDEFNSPQHAMIRQLLKLRQLDVLRYGDIKIYSNDGLAYIKRTLNGKKMTLVLNLSGKEYCLDGTVVVANGYADGVLQNKGFAVFEQ